MIPDVSAESLTYRQGNRIFRYIGHSETHLTNARAKNIFFILFRGFTQKSTKRATSGEKPPKKARNTLLLSLAVLYINRNFLSKNSSLLPKTTVKN